MRHFTLFGSIASRTVCMALTATLLFHSSPAYACRLALPRPPQTQAMSDESQVRAADVAAIGGVTLLDPSSGGVQVEIQPTEFLRGSTPLPITIGPEVILITCLVTAPMSQLLDQLSLGDEVLVLAAWSGAELMPFNILRTDDVEAVRLLSLLHDDVPE